jgi:dGTPase
LNLTIETLDGILKHRGLLAEGRKDKTIEGQIVRFSDKIAYVQHDIDDSLRAGVLQEEDLPRELVAILGDTHGKRIATLVEDIIYYNQPRLEAGVREIGMTPALLESFQAMRQFMFETVYDGSYCKAEREKAGYILEFLFKYFCLKPYKLPIFYQEIADHEGKERAVVDYLSGMTDQYCVALFQAITIPVAKLL